MVALIPIGVVLLALLGYPAFIRWRDWSVHRRPFPAHWLSILEDRLPVYSLLPPAQQSRLQDMIKFFIARKRYYGCGGLVVTDEMRLVIAAEACLLVLGRGGALYPKLNPSWCTPLHSVLIGSNTRRMGLWPRVIITSLESPGTMVG